jgi:beta-1,4-mannosyl-glycoprotein beta-1,4-N-acetylglucosaminyltransferase
MRQKIILKNLKYSFWRIDKNKDIEIINNGGWHFNNIFSPKDISIKLKTFAHTEFSKPEFSDTKVIKEKIDKNKKLGANESQLAEIRAYYSKKYNVI